MNRMKEEIKDSQLICLDSQIKEVELEPLSLSCSIF